MLPPVCALILVAVAPLKMLSQGRPKVATFSGVDPKYAEAMGYWKPRGGGIKGTVSSSVLPLVVVVSPLFA
ncbi:hypothetical protein SLW73_08330 [Glutamicibacter protophormiae]|uniref:hypothetical protein n=1 Tax=Glutamicibacter protophormiae TaxID=37930 RepID=UPI002A836D77|nr:hypothetical protein [Glutamicibacter protophormiae]WPR69795.1 hypothetical protein SLW73_08330 [Glutamicibacter protophormiae]